METLPIILFISIIIVVIVFAIILLRKNKRLNQLSTDLNKAISEANRLKKENNLLGQSVIQFKTERDNYRTLYDANIKVLEYVKNNINQVKTNNVKQKQITDDLFKNFKRVIAKLREMNIDFVDGHFVAYTVNDQTKALIKDCNCETPVLGVGNKCKTCKKVIK